MLGPRRLPPAGAVAPYAPRVAARRDAEEPPDSFRVALAGLRAAVLRPEVVQAEAPAPQRLAPWAVALTADVVVDGDELATGRFVLLHDPAGHDAWAGAFRVVTFVRAELDAEMVDDPLLPAVGWAWLTEALHGRGLPYHAASGTVTRVSSESFGGLADRPPSAEIEIRASWTPGETPDQRGGDLAAPPAGEHLVAWSELLCQAAGLPPLPPGVRPLPHRPARPDRGDPARRLTERRGDPRPRPPRPG